jgi:hypothetical protein
MSENLRNMISQIDISFIIYLLMLYLYALLKLEEFKCMKKED